MNKILLNKILHRLLYSIILFVGILFVAFLLFNYSDNKNSFHGYNTGFILLDFISWISSLITSMNLGYTQNGQPVFEKIFIPGINTLILTFSALAIGFIMSVVIGWYWSNNSKNKWVDTFVRVINVFSSIPLFLAAFVIAYLVHYVIIDIYADSISLSHTIIYYTTPILVLTFFDGFLAEMITFIKIRFDEIRSEQFITALDLRGGNISKHIIKHIFNDLLSVINSKFLTLIGGAIVVEIIFGWRGIGLQGFDAVITRDYSLFMGVLIFTSISIIIFKQIVFILTIIFDKSYKLRLSQKKL